MRTLLACAVASAAGASVSRLGPALRGDFAVLNQKVWEDRPLVYLDSAATSQAAAARAPPRAH